MNLDFEAGWWDPESGSQLPEDIRKKQRAASLLGCARSLENIQREIHEQNLMNAQLYSNRELAAFDWGNGALHRASLAPINRTGENLVLSTVDTLVAQVGKQRPKAKPQTRGASWKLRKQVRLLDKFLYGEFIRNRIYEHGKQVFRDACIFSFGGMFVTMVDGRLHCERVFPDEILIDQMEVVACGKPRHVYRRRVLPMEVVSSTWDVPMEELEMRAKAGETYLDYRAVGKGYCVVVEGWQMNGHYMCATNEIILDEKPWDRDDPPFVFYHWQVPVSGFYSPSAVEQALPYQIRINEINEVIRDAQDIMGRPRLLVAEGSRVNPMELDNLIARVIKYTGIKPEPANWGTVDSALYQERDRLVRMCQQQFGLSNQSVSAAPPPGARFDSAPAWREYNATQDDRLADPSQRLERFYLDVAELMIRTIEYSGEKPTTMWYSGGRYARCEEIDWKKIDLDKNSYVMQLEATSLYDQGPAAIRDDLEKQFAMGIISPEQYRLERAHPDDSSELSLQAAAAADIRRVIELLEDGKYEEPTPVQDLVNGVQMVTLALLNLNQYSDDEYSDDDDESSNEERAEMTELEKVKYNFLNWLVAARGILDEGTETAGQAPGSPMMSQLDEMGGGAPMGSVPMPGTGQSLGGAGAIPVPEAMGLA